MQVEIDDVTQKNKRWSPGHIYVIDYGDGKTFKIGRTRGEPEKRLNQIARLNVIMPMHLVFSAYVGTNASMAEEILHMSFDYQSVLGEWYSLDFAGLCSLYIKLASLSQAGVKVYDRWYDNLVPKDYIRYIENYGVSCVPFMSFERGTCMIASFKAERDDTDFTL